jgi:hypothetical protein
MIKQSGGHESKPKTGLNIKCIVSVTYSDKDNTASNLKRVERSDYGF